MKRRYSIRQSLLLSLTLLVLLTAGGILTVTVLGALRASDELTRQVIDEAGLLVSEEVHRYFDEVERSLRIVARWAEANDLGPEDGDYWEPLLLPLIRESPRVSSVLVANASGAEFMLLEDPIDLDSWTMRLVDPRRWTSQALIQQWHVDEGIRPERLDSLNYDARNRLYFQTALASGDGRVTWTPPTVFFTTHDPGITAATYWTAGTDTTVLAFDVLLLDISRMTVDTDVSERGIAFVLSDETTPRVVGLPREGTNQDDATIRARLLSTRNGDPDTAPELPIAGRSGNAVLDAAVLAWTEQGHPADTVPFEHDGEAWWGSFIQIKVGNNAFVAGTAAPEADFLGTVSEAARGIALIALIAVVLATILATRLATGYARPLEALAAASRRIQTLDLAPTNNVESRVSEIHDLVSEQERTRVALDSFARYMPVEIVRDLVARGTAARLGGERRVITILFTDIEGFTTVAEGRTAEEVTALLTEYFEMLLEAIRAHGGEVNELLGDGVVAYWGAPVPSEDHAARAVAAILACHERGAALNEQFLAEGKPVLSTRFGVASGEVVIGNVGSKSRLAYKAVGDTANLASRIEGLNKFYGTRMLVSEETKELAGEVYEWREVDAVRVKGRGRVTHLYEPLGVRGEVTPERLAFRDQYEAALAHFRAGRFERAIQTLETLATGGDRSVERLIRLSREQLRDGTPAGAWDGITVFHTK